MQRTTKSSLATATVLLLAVGATGIGYRLGVVNRASALPNSEVTHSNSKLRIDFDWPSESVEDKSSAPFVGDADVRPTEEPLSIHVPPLETGFLLNSLWPLTREMCRASDDKQAFSFHIAMSR
jgi:hypothetical protein